MIIFVACILVWLLFGFSGSYAMYKCHPILKGEWSEVNSFMIIFGPINLFACMLILIKDC